MKPKAAKAAPLPAAAHAALGDMVDHRYGLYARDKAKTGYSADPAGGLVWPGIAIDQLVELGLAVHEPSGGAHGSVKATDKGRDHYADLRRPA